MMPIMIEGYPSTRQLGFSRFEKVSRTNAAREFLSGSLAVPLLVFFSDAETGRLNFFFQQFSVV